MNLKNVSIDKVTGRKESRRKENKAGRYVNEEH